MNAHTYFANADTNDDMNLSFMLPYAVKETGKCIFIIWLHIINDVIIFCGVWSTSVWEHGLRTAIRIERLMHACLYFHALSKQSLSRLLVYSSVRATLSSSLLFYIVFKLSLIKKYIVTIVYILHYVTIHLRS